MKFFLWYKVGYEGPKVGRGGAMWRNVASAVALAEAGALAKEEACVGGGVGELWIMNYELWIMNYSYAVS